MVNVPIVVGVTGHRRLRQNDISLLKEKIREELLSIKKKAPDSPLILLDSLALGGDAICAEVALELGYELEVPLPFENEEYEKDFDEENLRIYHEQKAKAKRVFELGKLSDLKERDDGYRNAGLYIATHSHIVIALWDGAKGKPNGCGTAGFVDYVREGFDSSLIIPTPFISIIHISAVREGKEGKAGEVILYERKKGCTDKLLSDTNNFNRDAKEKELKEYSLLKEKKENKAIKFFDELYRKADALSLHYQKEYLKTMKYTSIIGVGIVLSLLFYNQMDITGLLVIYAILPVISKALVNKALNKKYLERYIEARCLAESCRVQIYLLFAGVQRSIAYAYPWSIREDNDWIIKAMMTRLTYNEENCEDKKLAKELIEGQLSYHQNALKKEKRSNRKAKNSSKVIKWITILNYLIVFAFEFINADILDSTLFMLGSYSIDIKALSKITLGIVSAIAALLNNYYGKLSLSRKVEDHERYIDLYTEVLKKGENCDEKSIWSVAEEELSENSAWRTYMKSNSPSVIIK